MTVLTGNRGFTTIELAIVLILFGFSTLFLLDVWNRYQNRQAINTTLNESFADSRETLIRYATAFNYYPCPANPTLGPGDPNYGRERRDLVSGVCIVEAGIELVNNGRDVGLPAKNREVLIGAVPFMDASGTIISMAETLDFSAVDTLDGWGNKLTYAVTRALADNDGVVEFNDQNGMIFLSENIGDQTAVDANAAPIPAEGYPIIQPPGSLHAVIVSHGPNAYGAYSEDGNIIGDCTPSFFGSPEAFSTW